MNPLLIVIAISCLSAGLSLAQVVNLYLDKYSKRLFKDELLGRVANSGSSGGRGSIKFIARQNGQISNREKIEAVKRLAARLRTGARTQHADKVKLRYDSELAMLIDITTLGMRAGMAFDQAFGLALERFPGEVSTLCQAKSELWQKGLISREQGLHELESEIPTVLFSRFAALVKRAIRYGVPMTTLLTALSDETRRDIRIRREEEVAKAPVKMLIPTGVLILPAMLLLVLGPIMLDLINKM